MSSGFDRAKFRRDAGSAVLRKPAGRQAVPSEFLDRTVADSSRLSATLAHADGATRARVLNHLQRQHGNAFVQRLVAPLGGERAVQREEPAAGGDASDLLRMRPGEGEAKKKASDLLRLRLDPATVKPALAKARPDWLPAPLPPEATSAEEPKSYEPGPAKPKPGELDDFLEAISKVPEIDRATTKLQSMALGRLKRDWSRLSTGGKIIVSTTTALITGGALAGALSSPEGRRFALDQINGRILPVPGVNGLSFEVSTKGRNTTAALDLDVGALLPEWMGFGPSEPKPIGGPLGVE